jgi:hypothetical protein
VPNSKVSSWLTKVTVLTTKIALTFLYYLSSPPLMSHSLVGSDTLLFNKSQYFIQKENNIKTVFCFFFNKEENLKKKKKPLKRVQNRIA